MQYGWHVRQVRADGVIKFARSIYQSDKLREHVNQFVYIHHDNDYYHISVYAAHYDAGTKHAPFVGRELAYDLAPDAHIPPSKSLSNHDQDA